MNKETKVCNKCSIEKPLDEFYKSGKYYRGKCKECINLYNKNNRQDYYKKYRLDNKEKRNEYNKKYYKENKEIIKEKYKEYYINWRKNNKEHSKQYRKDNLEKIKQQQNIRQKEKIKKDKIYKLKHNLRVNVNKLLKNKNIIKKQKTEQIIGCDIEIATNYLLETFKKNYGYKWDGIEPVHIDHIIPLATAKTEEEVIKLFNYKNLQLLKAQDNLRKGAKLDWRIDDVK